jgi:hypothetical protein
MESEVEKLKRNRKLERHHRVRAEKKFSIAFAALNCVLSEPDKKIADFLADKALKDIKAIDERMQQPEPEAV